MIFENVIELLLEVFEVYGVLLDWIVVVGGRMFGGFVFELLDMVIVVCGDMIIDGLFIESKELLFGVFVIEVCDFDYVIEFVKMILIVDGGVEVCLLIGWVVMD